MGMSVGAAGHKSGRGRRRGVPRYGAMAEINMTPFIDVMLVLLIIFMVAAPLLATGVPIDLPQTKAAALNIEQKPLAIAIDDKGQVFLMDQPVAVEQRQAFGGMVEHRARAALAFEQAVAGCVARRHVAQVRGIGQRAGRLDLGDRRLDRETLARPAHAAHAGALAHHA